MQYGLLNGPGQPEPLALAPGLYFSDLVKIAALEPAKFVEIRHQLIEQALSEMPPALQPRMRAMQVQIDHFCALNPSPSARMTELARLQCEAMGRLVAALYDLDEAVQDIALPSTADAAKAVINRLRA